MTKFLIIATAALAMVPAMASAQDAGDTAFSGPFVGAQAGWGQRSIDNAAVDQSRDGIEYGGFAGFDHRIGTNIVLGAEAGIGGGGKTLSQTIAGVGTTELDPRWNWNVSGRAGFLASPDLLFYGRVGYGRERVRASFASATAAPSTSDSGWSDGAIYGGGVEYALSPRTSVRAEYRYSDFDGGYHPQAATVGVAFRF